MSQSEDFAWAIAFACMMADFQNAVTSRIFSVFFRAVFCREHLEMICRMDFDMFFGILIFEPKLGFFMGYSLCMHDGRFSKFSHFSNI